MKTGWARVFGIWILGTLLPAAFVSAQNPTVQVRSLYDAQSMIPNVLIPFQLSSNLSVQTVSAAADVSADCRTMKDPWFANIFLLKCSRDVETVNLTILATDGTKTYQVAYGPLAIANPSGITPVDPPSDSGGDGANPDVLAGKQLFSTDCIGCHTPPSKQGRTASQIQTAVLTVPEMKSAGLKNSLSASDYKKLAAYLGNL